MIEISIETNFLHSEVYHASIGNCAIVVVSFDLEIMGHVSKDYILSARKVYRLIYVFILRHQEKVIILILVILLSLNSLKTFRKDFLV